MPTSKPNMANSDEGLVMEALTNTLGRDGHVGQPATSVL